MGLVVIIGGYLVAGIVALFLFDRITGRIRSKFSQSSLDAQSALIGSGNYVNTKTAKVILAGAIWLFWPAVFLGALTDKKEDDNTEK